MGVAIRELSTPSDEPITLVAAKEHLRMFDDHGDEEDGFITTLIVTARRWVERRTSRLLRAVEVDLVLDAFPAVIELPFTPVSSIVSITYIDGLGVQQTLDAGAYQADLIGRPHVVCPVFGSVWPVTETRLNAVTVTFRAGHTTTDPVPEDMLHGMKMLISHWDRNREALVIGTISKEIEMGVDSLVLPYRVPFA